MEPGNPVADSRVLPAGRLERMLGKPPCEFTVDDLVAVVEDLGVRIVSLMHVGGDGNLKTLDFAPRSESHLRDVILGGERADGSSLFSGAGLKAGASDIVLRPRPERAFLDPFAPQPTLAILCAHFGRDGLPLPESPDTIVRRGHARLLQERGVDLWALGEVEYFLGRMAGDGDIYGRSERGYHATSPFVFGEPLRRRALAILAEIGVPVKYGHSEVGYIEAGEKREEIWEQHEIELGLAPLPEAAEAIVLAQWVVRNLAHAGGFRVSFEPIVRVGHAGSGMHIHLSPVVAGEHRGGRVDGGELPIEAQWLIAGLVRLAGALMLFGNRTEASFIRLSQGKEAPRQITWGEFDRNALIRLPISARTSDGRLVSPQTVELRLPDGSAHPHLLLAGVAQAAVHAAGLPDIAGILDATRSSCVRVQPSVAEPVPRTTAQVAAAVAEHRATLEAGGVFPVAYLDLAAASQRGP